jgi:hypothetical protein
MAPRTARRSRENGRSSERPLRFEQRLVLHQWLLGLFGVSSFERLAANLRAPELEGFDENNVSRFYHQLRLLFEQPELPHDILLAYDQNIVRHWRQITEKRNHAGPFLYPKYFQYLALLFTEIYLDRYFRDPDGLLAQLNERVTAFNQTAPEASRIEPYSKQDLNKVAFWMATGSGKTLLMHINILQYQHYLNLYGGKPVNRVILLTPNEGLSHQHLEEFHLSGIDAELFSKEGRGLFTGRAVEILDIHKLREEMGEKTVAVDAFEGNNLVLVDEGHRGTSGAEIGAWMQKRNQLCENGFSFEYSATFGQAMKASGNRALEQVYAKCILFDYSYKYFYGDGYGKDYRILNLTDDSDENVRRKYLTACLLTFYQQLKLYRDKPEEFRPFLIERPLWIFVGGSVNAVRMKDGRKVSDVVDILLSLATFVRDRRRSVEIVQVLLAGQSGLLDAKGRDLFQGTYRYLNTLGLTPDQIFDDILRVLFNASTPAALHVENLKGTDGEVALRLGDNEAFGVINVGDASALCKLCEEQEELVVTEKEFSGSLFRALNDEASTINILIGSKKFTEGWSSWRVSTMGLMNIGKNEGPQIIQLFGRGVRLKGKDFSLKRSRRLEGQAAPKNIETLETLNIFGIRADYMRQFKEYLEDEGLPANEDRIEFVLPVIKNLGSKKLKMVRLREDIDFKKNGQKPVLESEPPDYLRKYPVVLDWYPKLQAMASGAGRTSAPAAERDRCHFEESHLAFLDLDAIYFELQQFKNERGWHNLTLPRRNLATLLARKDWYVLYIPKEEMEFGSFRQLFRWQEIATTLLKKYLEPVQKAGLACEAADHHMDHRHIDQRTAALYRPLLILRQTTVPVEPTERPLHNPPLRLHHEPLLPAGLPNQQHRHPDKPHRPKYDRRISRISKHPTQPGGRPLRPQQHLPRPIPIRNRGRSDHQPPDQPQGVNHQMPLPPADLFFPRRTPAGHPARSSSPSGCPQCPWSVGGSCQPPAAPAAEERRESSPRCRPSATPGSSETRSGRVAGRGATPARCSPPGPDKGWR